MAPFSTEDAAPTASLTEPASRFSLAGLRSKLGSTGLRGFSVTAPASTDSVARGTGPYLLAVRRPSRNPHVDAHSPPVNGAARRLSSFRRLQIQRTCRNSLYRTCDRTGHANSTRTLSAWLEPAGSPDDPLNKSPWRPRLDGLLSACCRRQSAGNSGQLPRAVM